MKPRHKRLALIGGSVAFVAVAVGLVLNAFQSNLVFFYSPSQVVAKKAPASRTFRPAGLGAGRCADPVWPGRGRCAKHCILDVHAMYDRARGVAAGPAVRATGGHCVRRNRLLAVGGSIGDAAVSLLNPAPPPGCRSKAGLGPPPKAQLFSK